MDCKVFVAACASSIFIRNCSNCTFYTCCRQLRLREVTNCTFYIYSMAEVHIEYSNNLRFAPFNGGYPDHAKHLAAANLNVSHNLWYDIYDHNDPGKTHANWSLLPEAEYEVPWYPLGPCDPAIPRSKPDAVNKPQTDEKMQSFSIQQMIQDAQKLNVTAPPPAPAAANSAAVDVKAEETDKDKIVAIITRYANLRGGQTIQDVAAEGFHVVLSSGVTATLPDVELSAPANPSQIESIMSHKISGSNDLCVIEFKVKTSNGATSYETATLVKHSDGSWKLVSVQKSEAR